MSKFIAIAILLLTPQFLMGQTQIDPIDALTKQLSNTSHPEEVFLIQKEMVDIHIQRKEYNRAELIIREALYLTLNPNQKSALYKSLGECFLRRDKLLEGLGFLLKAEDLMDETFPDIVHLKTRIGSVYDELELFEKTTQYGLEAQKIAQERSDHSGELRSIFAIVSGAFAEKNFSLVKKSCQRAIDLVSENSIEKGELVYIYYLLGKVKLIENEPDRAITFFEKSAASIKNAKDSMSISSAQAGLAMAYDQLNNNNKALHYTELALTYTPSYLLDRTLSLSQIFAKNNDYSSAFKLLEKDAIQRNEWKNRNNPSHVLSNLLEERYNVEKNQLQSDLVAQRKIGNRNMIIALGAALLSFLTFIFFYNKRKNQSQQQKLIRQVNIQTQEILAQKEQLQRLDDAKNRLYTNITHEFRTPLTVISGIADQLSLEPHKRELIKRNSQQLLQLVNQMLELRKLEMGDSPNKMIQSDIIRFIRFISESFQSYAASSDISFHFLSDVEMLMMDFDKEKITRIISNLLSNAIKFTPKGGHVYIEMAVDGAQAISDKLQVVEEEQLILSVRDTGIGIPKEKLPHIFDRFFQIDQSEQKTEIQKGGGTGIGLTLVKEIMTALNGEIHVNSIQNKGTKFTLTFPITRNAPLEAADHNPHLFDFEGVTTNIEQLTPSTQLNDHGSSEKPFILLIEDNADVIHYLISCLRSDYEIEIAMNGEEGIEKAIRIIPDLIISDVMMPNKDGFEVCQTLKEDERTSHIPITLLTAKVDLESKLVGLKKGADAYLNKPFHQEELLSTLDNQRANQTTLQNYFRHRALATQEESNVLNQLGDIEVDPMMENKFLKKIRDIVEADISNGEIGMTQLIKQIGMSRSQIYKKVKALTGQSPSVYIRSIRLYHAQELLKSKELNISEVAYAVGFTSPSYFSDTYLEEFGIRPNETRK